MGIRVHKFLGYGLTDIEPSGPNQTKDPRINADSLEGWNDWGWEEATLERYAKYLKEPVKGDELARAVDLDLWFMREKEKKEIRRRLYDCLAYSPEYGLNNVLVLQPLSCVDWSRHDNIIDYTVETYLRDNHEEGPINYVEVLRHGIYPWNASYMDKRTGEKVPDEIMWWIRATDKDGNPRNGITKFEIDALAHAAEFVDHKEARQNIVPIIPQDIKNLVNFTELFTSPDTWKELRPMLYTYWS